jgi:hypothetical protein
MQSKPLRFCFAPAVRSLGSARRVLYDPPSRFSAAPKIGKGIKNWFIAGYLDATPLGKNGVGKGKGVVKNGLGKGNGVVKTV